MGFRDLRISNYTSEQMAPRHIWDLEKFYDRLSKMRKLCQDPSVIDELADPWDDRPGAQDEIRKRLSETSALVQEKKRELEDAQKDIISMKTLAEQSMQIERQRHEEQMKLREEELKTVIEKQSEKMALNDKKAVTLDEAMQEIQDLTLEMNKKQKEIDQLRTEKEEFQIRLSTVKEEAEVKDESTNELLKEKTEAMERAERSEIEIKRQEESIKEYEDEISKLQGEIKKKEMPSPSAPS